MGSVGWAGRLAGCVGSSRPQLTPTLLLRRRRPCLGLRWGVPTTPRPCAAWLRRRRRPPGAVEEMARRPSPQPVWSPARPRRCPVSTWECVPWRSAAGELMAHAGCAGRSLGMPHTSARPPYARQPPHATARTLIHCPRLAHHSRTPCALRRSVPSNPWGAPGPRRRAPAPVSRVCAPAPVRALACELAARVAGPACTARPPALYRARGAAPACLAPAFFAGRGARPVPPARPPASPLLVENAQSQILGRFGQLTGRARGRARQGKGAGGQHLAGHRLRRAAPTTSAGLPLSHPKSSGTMPPRRAAAGGAGACAPPGPPGGDASLRLQASLRHITEQAEGGE